MKRIHISFAIFLFSLTTAYGQSFSQLRIELENCIRDNNIPGAGVAVVNKDSVLFTCFLGYADIEKNLSITPQTHFALGSITKSFTALGFCKLADEGLIDLDTPIKEILPDLNIQNSWDDTDPVRVVHLLEHTAGICDGFTTLFNWQYDPDILLSDALQLHDQIVIYHRPGSFFLYSNIGYLLAGMVLEKITQMRYEEYLKQEFLIPLGMKTSTFDIKDSYSRSVLAQGYGVGGKEIPYLYIFPRAAGHTHSSVLDMTQYVRFFLNYGKSNGVQILKPETVTRIETPVTSLASRKGLLNGYGLGSEWAFRNQYKWRGHNGAQFGFYSDFWYNHDLDIGYVVFVNQFDFQSARNVRKLRDLVATHLTENTKPVFQPTLSVDKIQLKKYCGTYTIGYNAKNLLGLINYLNGRIEVQLSGDTLLLKQSLEGSEIKILPVSNGLFRKQDLPEPTVAFFTTPEGAKAMVNGRDYLEEWSPWKYWLTVVFLIWSILVMCITVIYALFWVPAYVYKKVSKKNLTIQVVTVRIIPFIAILVLITGLVLIGNQEIYYMGKITFANISFFISTWLFAILSIVGLVAVVFFFKKTTGRISRVHNLITACTLLGMTLFLWYWGVIGLKLWI